MLHLPKYCPWPLQNGFPEILPDAMSIMALGDMSVAYEEAIADEENFELHEFDLCDPYRAQEEAVYENSSAVRVSSLRDQKVCAILLLCYFSPQWQCKVMLNLFHARWQTCFKYA